jgi:hypothetical protein
MNVDKLVELVNETTQVYRKGNPIEVRREKGASVNVSVVEIYAYPHTGEAPTGEGFEKIDMHFIDVVVNKKAAEEHDHEFAEVMKGYPDQKRLADGPSYIELAGVIGVEQETAFRLMALGKVAGLWDLMTPEILLGKDAPKDLVNQMAGMGMINVIGIRYPEAKKVKQRR